MCRVKVETSKQSLMRHRESDTETVDLRVGKEITGVTKTTKSDVQRETGRYEKGRVPAY